MNIERLPFKGILEEMQSWSDSYSKKLFRDKIIRVYIKCLKSNRILLATKIADKYRTELTSTLRTDLDIATNWALFCNTLNKHAD